MEQERRPILRPLDNIQHRDAILEFDKKDNPKEPEWPEADFIIGNPPFLGGKRLRNELGDKYVNGLFELYDGRVPAEADLVTYWFEKARAEVEAGTATRVGLLATQAIRGGANRTVLERIKDSGEVFFAYSDRTWILDGADVHVSIVGFDDGNETIRVLNDVVVPEIYANLTADIDVTDAQQLSENANLAFQGPVKVGKFELSNAEAQKMLASPNPHGLPNSLVVKPWMNGSDLKYRPLNRWIIDFGEMPESEAALFEEPFELLRKRVMPKRLANRDKQRRENWWRLGRSGGISKRPRRAKRG